MMMNNEIKENDDDDDTTSIHTKDIQIYNQPKGKHNYNHINDDNSRNEHIDDWLSKLAYKSPLMQQQSKD